MNERVKTWLSVAGDFLKAILKWVLVAVLVGIPSGLLGTAFHVGVEKVTEFRAGHAWILFLLPVAGLAIVGIYRILHVEGIGTNHILKHVQTGQELKFGLLPAIFSSTILTHLVGGSAGREGAALQMGGTIGYSVGKALHLDSADLRATTMIGMSAFFSALFGTPLGATVFVLEVISVGKLYHAAFLPCFISSLTAFWLSTLLGVEPTRFQVAVPAADPVLLLKVAGLGVLCAFVSVLFCWGIHQVEHVLEKGVPNPWLRAAAGGAVLLVLSLLLQTGDYNGAGMGIITKAIEGGEAKPLAFLLKLLFTAITLGAGFKGGEVVPSFFVGATFGCVVGPLLGIPAGFAAAVGLIAVFCGAVNCPLASTVLAVELFGAAGILFYALACGISYVLSGYSGLYSSQQILSDKLKLRDIQIYTNSHRHKKEPKE